MLVEKFLERAKGRFTCGLEKLLFVNLKGNNLFKPDYIRKIMNNTPNLKQMIMQPDSDVSIGSS